MSMYINTGLLHPQISTVYFKHELSVMRTTVTTPKSSRFWMIHEFELEVDSLVIQNLVFISVAIAALRLVIYSRFRYTKENAEWIQ